jgi:hypothetical protein
MPILADAVDGVIGVDTHRDTLAAAAVTPIGRIIAQTQTSADTDGYHTLLDFARTQVPGQRCWAAREHWQLWRRAGLLPAQPRRAGRGGRPPQAAGQPQWRQERRGRRGPRRPSRHSPSTTHRHLAGAATARRCGCC